VDLVGVRPEDGAVEVGSGLGTLTRAIGRVARRTVALEVDRGLVEYLREQDLPASVEIRHLDALKADLPAIAREIGPPVVLLGNLPYRIAGRLLGSLLGPGIPFRRLGLMLQSEVADRVLSLPGSPGYGALSVWASLWTVPERALALGPEAFEPRPRVRSAFVLFDPIPGPEIADVQLLRRLVRASFQQRRKMLRTALRRTEPAILDACAQAGLDPTLRAEKLSPEEFVRLANALSEEGPA
jgi:16S rRNA (adenine1518-N6/adenine1519-N6)-dimethyltransferase